MSESAFPIPLDDRPGAYPAEPGLTKREWFLTVTMPLAMKVNQHGHADGWLGIARIAYSMADAMLEAGSDPEPVQCRPLYADEKARLDAADRLAEAVGAIKKTSIYLAIPQDLRGALERALEDVTEPVLPF